MKKSLSLLFITITCPVVSVLAMEPQAPSAQRELYVAAKEGNIEAIEAALEKGAQVNVSFGEDKETALHAAVDQGKLDAVKKLLEVQGVDLNKKNIRGETPLHTAIVDRSYLEDTRVYFEIMKLLVERGADVTITDNLGNSVLHFVSGPGGQSFGPEGEGFLEHFLKKHPVDVNTQNKKGATVLHLIANAGGIKNAELIVKEKEEKVDPNLKDTEGNTPLHKAVELNVYPSIVKELLKLKKIKINLQNNKGFSPLHTLAETMNTWEDYGKSRGKAPEDFLKKHTEVAEMLFERGIDPTLTSKEGKTALEMAEGNYTKKVIGDLMQAR